MADLPKAHILRLPAELRDEIYRLLLNPESNRRDLGDGYSAYEFAPSLSVFRLNRQIYFESRKIFRDLNVFIRIETPWAEACRHVAREGHVPIVVSEERAKDFSGYSLNVAIDAPRHVALDSDNVCFILHLDDLGAFTRMWFYSDLTNPGLNEHLQLTLTPRDPFIPDWEEMKVSKALQRKMLIPFGEVKNLYGTRFAGGVKIYGSIKNELSEVQAQPYQSPEHCLREATRNQAEGDAELQKGNYRNALALYDQAWLAMHVVVKGRSRHIHGDAFFGRELREEPYVGKNGISERLILRVQLVAKSCQAYLELKDYDEVCFWGMRSINVLREQMVDEDFGQHISPADEAILGFPGADQLGEIYLRTAIAFQKTGELFEAKRLLLVAKEYFANDEKKLREVLAALE